MQIEEHELRRIEGKAKNVLFFLGDGLSVPTITAARILKGQQIDKLPFGEEAELHMDKLPHVAVSKVVKKDRKLNCAYGFEF
jgi:alkaline phosphatase